LELTRQQVLQEREEIKSNITMMVEMLANHKQHVEDRLKDLQQFYTEQYNALQM
jgi:flagellar capping protein FliD